MTRGFRLIELSLKDMKHAHIKADDGRLAGILQIDQLNV